MRAALLDFELQREEFLESKPLTRRVYLMEFVREMQLANGFEITGAREKELLREFVREVQRALQNSPDDSAKPALGEAFGERVNRHNSFGMN